MTPIMIALAGLAVGGVTAVLGAFASPFTDTGNKMMKAGAVIMIVFGLVLAYALGYFTDKIK